MWEGLNCFFTITKVFKIHIYNLFSVSFTYKYFLVTISGLSKIMLINNRWKCILILWYFHIWVLRNEIVNQILPEKLPPKKSFPNKRSSELSLDRNPSSDKSRNRSNYFRPNFRRLLLRAWNDSKLFCRSLPSLFCRSKNGSS